MSTLTPDNALVASPETTMFNPANPSTRIEETDPIKMTARLDEAKAEQLLMTEKGFLAPSGATEEEAAAAKLQWDYKLADLINEQLGLIMKLRKTSTGPAAKGGKRAKKAPLDLKALEESLGMS